jgi:hypothetical protein
MIKPFTERQKKMIVKNLILACADINQLNKQGYDFIYQANGFIAHYDLHGFKAAYSDGSLQSDIERNARMNMWGNFREGDQNYDYYMSRKDIYQRILGAFSAQEFVRQHIQFIHVGA